MKGKFLTGEIPALQPAGDGETASPAVILTNKTGLKKHGRIK
jgi:hypothetical protein